MRKNRYKEKLRNYLYLCHIFSNDMILNDYNRISNLIYEIFNQINVSYNNGYN